MYRIALLFQLQIWLTFHQLAAQDFSSRLYDSYLTGNMCEWERVIAEMKEIYTCNGDKAVLFDIIHTQYGYIGYLLGAKKYEQAKPILSEAFRNASMLTAYKPDWVEAIALESALMAYSIAISPYRVLFLGFESINRLNLALALEPGNPMVLIEKANSRHYAPLLIGGSPSEAVGIYSKAVALIEEEHNGASPRSWWYLNALTQQALAAEKSGQYALAGRVYRKILLIAPEFKWVKDRLWPAYLKKYTSK